MNELRQIEEQKHSDPLIGLISEFEGILSPLGLEVVDVETLHHHPKTLRVCIGRSDKNGDPIGIEDCVRANEALNEKLDTPPLSTQVEEIFKGTYELEISSPGLERTLKRNRDFERELGSRVLVHVFRPLTAEESANPEFIEEHPKQKQFLGKLEAFDPSSQVIELMLETQEKRKKGQLKSKNPKKQTSATESIRRIRIPISLISKAKLSPEFSLS